MTPFVNWVKQKKTEGPLFSSCLGKVTDNLGCFYKKGDMIALEQERVVCFVLI